VNTEGSFCACQAVFCCSPPRQVLPSSRPAALTWAWGRCLQPGGLQDQPVPHRSAPQACPPLPRILCPQVSGRCSPTSLHCWVQPRDGGTQTPAPTQSHDMVLLSAPAQGHTVPWQSPNKCSLGSTESCPWGGTMPGTSTHGGLPGGEEAGRGDHAAAFQPALVPTLLLLCWERA